ncbi:hypothetical protein M9Y10_000047 [Tritrichomonas musculus]|uniref:Non-specific serine/threonine protein kinase n=1 Tax=Tritrichomonas musculus TaxID=1915356 RepID=A0ABR2L386_9EUKA
MENFDLFIDTIQDFPYPTDATLDIFEDILVFSVNSLLQSKVDYLINYLIHYLEFFLKSNQQNSYLICRFLSILHLIRPQITSLRYSELIEEIAFQYLEKTNGNSCKLAFIVIVDHFSICLPANQNKIENLFSWIFQQIDQSTLNISEVDIDLILLIVQSLKHIFDISDLKTAKEIIIKLIDSFLKFIDAALCYKNSPNMNILISKILKLVARFIECSKTISPESLTILIKLQNTIKDSIEDSHVFQNYLLCLCFLLSFDENNRPTELIKFFILVILNNMHLFVYPPFNKRRCILQFITSLSQYTDNIKTKTASTYQNIMPSIWPMIGNYHIKTVRQATTIIQSLLTSEILRDKLTCEFLNQIISSFELMYIDYKMFDFHQKQAQFDSDSWIDSNHHLIHLFFLVLSHDVPQRADSGFFLIMSRLFKYISFLVDQIGLITHPKSPDPTISIVFLSQVSQRDFVDRTMIIFEKFSKILSLLNSNILHPILHENIKYILPDKSYHIYHKKLHQLILKTIKDPNAYFLSFFSNISMKFELIFMPKAQPNLLDITRFAFIEAFLSENYQYIPNNSATANINTISKIKPNTNSNQKPTIQNFNSSNSGKIPLSSTTINSISYDLFRFVLKGIHSKDIMIIELLVTIFHSISQNCKIQRLSCFLSLIKQYQNELSYSITFLSEDPNLQLLLSLFALFLFPLLCQVPMKSVEYWTNLFIPAIESDAHSLTALRFFCNSTLRTFVQLMQQLRRQMKIKLINKLITSLPRLNRKEINYPRSLLSKIPDYTSDNLTIIDDPKSSHTLVLIGDYYIFADYIFNRSIKKKANPTTEDFNFLLLCMKYLIIKESFYYCSTSKFLTDVTAFISKLSPNLLNDDQNEIIHSINQLEEPKIYSFLFLKFRYLSNNKFNYKIERPEIFIEYLIQLLHSISTASTALSIINELLYQIPLSSFYVRLNYILISAASNDVNGCRKVIENHFLIQTINTPEEQKIAIELCSQYNKFSTQYSKQIRKVSLIGMKHYLTKFAMTNSTVEYRNQLIKDLPQIITKNKIADVLQFLFLFPFKDFPDPVSFVNKLIDALSTIQLKNVMKEVQLLMKDIRIQESPTYSLSIAKFCIKAILHFLVEIEESQPSLWEKFLITLRNDKFKQLLPFLLKYSKKLVKFKSLPTELLNIFGTSNKLPQFSCQLEDLLLLKFEIIYSPIKITTDLVNFIHTMLTNVIQKLSKQLIIPYTQQLFSIIKEVYSKNPVLTPELTRCVYISVEITLSPHLYAIPLSFPIENLVEELPELSYQILISKLKKSFSIDVIFLFCKLFINQNSNKFRSHCISNIENNLSKIFIYLESLSKNEFDFVLSTVLLNMEKVVNEIINEKELIKIQSISIGFFDKLQNRGNIFYFKPSLLYGFLEIFLPMKFVKQYTENSDLLYIFQNEILPLILSVPRIFYHLVFLNKIVKFMSEFPSISIREQIFKNIENMSADNAYEKSFILAIVYEYYKNFHADEEIELSVDFSSFSNKPSFPAVLLNYTATSIGLLKGVNLIDAGDCKTLFLLPHSHALGIKLKLVDLSTCFTLSRIVNISKILFSIDPAILDQKEITNKTILFFEKMPLVVPSSIRSFLAIGKNLRYYELNNRRFKQFIIQFFTANVTTVHQRPDKFSIYYMPYFFKGLLEQDQIHDRAFELCIFCSVMLLTKKFDQQLPVGQLLPSIIESLLPKVNKDLIDGKLMDQIQDNLTYYKLSSSEANKDSSFGDSMNMKLLMQLTSTLSEVLFKKKYISDLPNWFFSACLSPSIFFSSSYYTLLFPVYITAVQSCSKYDKMKTAFELTNQISIYYQNIIKSPKLKSPFASVAQWLNDVHKANENKILDKEELQLQKLLEALLPVNCEQMIFTLSTIKQPINPYALKLLEKTFKEEGFLQLKNICSNNPIAKLVYASKSSNIYKDLFVFDWFSIDQDYHLIIFLKFLFDEKLMNIIDEMNVDDLKSFASTAINQIEKKYPQFTNFVNFYMSIFPNSTLAQSFWPSSSHLFLESPLPYQSFLTNTSYLNQINFPEDALGILKLKVPELSTAVSFHQLSSYKAAQYYYQKEMYENGDKTYFFALNELRKVSFNLSLFLAPDLYERLISKTESNKPNINLPFIKDYNGKFIKENLTTFSSHVYLPFLMNSSIYEEVYHLLDCLQKRIAPKPQTLCNYNLMRTLDKQNMMASSLAWQLTIYQELKNSLAADSAAATISSSSTTSSTVTPTPAASIAVVEDLIRKSRILLCRILMRCGAIQSSMKQLLIGVQGRELSRIAHVSESNIVYLMPFISLIPTPLPNIALLKINCQIYLHDFKSTNSFKSTNLPPFDKLWLSAIVIIHQYYPEMLNLSQFFQRLQSDMSTSTSENLEFYLSLALSVIRKNKNFDAAFKCFETSMLANVEDKNKNLYLRWLPHFLYLFESLPSDFLISLFNRQSSHFLLIAYHSKYCKKIRNESNFDEVMKKIMNTKEGKEINEFETAFKWIKLCKEDILRLSEISQCHIKLYEMLKSNQVDQITDDMISFCLQNPPIFQTKRNFTSLTSFTGFKFPALPQRVMNVSLKADGKEEAMLNFITAKDGGIRNFMLVSPRIYRYTIAEHLFIQCISHYIDHHPSSRTRATFTFYPYVFLLHPDLLMIHLAPSIFHLIPMATQLQLGNYSKLFYDNCKLFEGKMDESPKSMKERREKALDLIFSNKKNNYKDIFLTASENFKINFLVLRQTFISHYAFYSSIRFIFGVSLPFVPSVCIFGDAMRCCIPSFFQFEAQKGKNDENISQIPLTRMFTEFVPNFMIHGTFATTWNTVPEVLANHHQQLRIFLQALVPNETPTENIENIIQNSKKMALQTSEICDKVDTVFPFELFNHLIECSQNSIYSQPLAYSWL